MQSPEMVAFEAWLTEHTAFPVKETLTGTRHFSEFLFADLAPWSGTAPS